MLLRRLLCLIFDLFNLLKENPFKINKEPISLSMDDNSIQKIISSYNRLGLSANAFAEETKLTDKALLSYLNTVEAGSATFSDCKAHVDATNNSIGLMGIKAKATSIGIGILKAAIGSVIALGISMLITKVVQSIEEANHVIENARDTIDNIKTDIKSLNDTFNEHKKTVDEIGDSYDKLSNGVDLSTLENISLSDNDYKEFLNVNREIADMFPSVVDNFNSQGEAILNLGKNGVSAATELRKLLEVEQDINNQKIMNDMPTYLKSFKTTLNNDKKDIDKYKDRAKELQSVKDEIEKISKSGYDMFNGSSYHYDGKTNNNKQLYYNAMKQAYQNLYDSSSKETQRQFDDKVAMFESKVGTPTLDINFNVINRFDSISDAIKYIKNSISPNLSLVGIRKGLSRHCTDETKKLLYKGFVWKYDR